MADPPPRDGTARFTDPGTGDTYEGDWKKGKRDGRGKMEYSDGEIYDGDWRDNKPHGNGCHRYEDGSTYVGEWRRGVRHGHGVYTSQSSRYDGDWKDDAMHGRGTYVYATGAVYEGDWRANKMEGRGVFRHPSGFVYDGAWKNNMKHGKMKKTTPDGSVFDVVYREDVCVNPGVKSPMSPSAAKSSPSPSSSSSTFPSVDRWLDSIGLSGYARQFEEAGFTEMQAIADLDERDMDAIGIKVSQHRKKLLTASKHLRASLPSGSLPSDTASKPSPSPVDIHPESQLEVLQAASEAFVSSLPERATIPRGFRCPISDVVMTDPVVAADGNTYERCAIEIWFKNQRSSPKSGLPLTDTSVKPDTTLREAIEKWREKVAPHRNP
eukprot:TRINITY_DN22441_c0_g1_i1.p1 TRINITY_DN22441_c0_g1~~TRINITY_DN22441_c0_g1_i1.p1  ORF type:complete len:393 (+),score=76.77 TRINITY_DN22441_c0_g1_i1:41-1180(+)